MRKEGGLGDGGINTLHVLFSLVYDESVTSVLLLRWRIVWSGDVCDDAYTLDWTEAAEFALEIFYFGVVAQPSDKQGLESIATDLGVVVRIDCGLQLEMVNEM